ncbi:MAG TPA: hypothetical protein VGI03_05130 [Verrucomicrobiae bacterium]
MKTQSMNQSERGGLFLRQKLLGHFSGKLIFCLLFLFFVLKSYALEGYWDPNFVSPWNSGVGNCERSVVAPDGSLYTIGTWLEGDDWPILQHWGSDAIGWENPTAQFYGGLQTLNSIAVSSNYLYVGGSFTNIYVPGDPPVYYGITNIAKMDLQTFVWSQVGDGTLGVTPPSSLAPGEAEDIVSAIYVDTHSNLYAGLMTEGDVSWSYLTNYVFVTTNGTTWIPIEGLSMATVWDPYVDDNFSPTNNGIAVFSIIGDNTNIYVGGDFAGAFNGGTPVTSPCVIEWNPANGWMQIANTDDYWSELDSPPYVLSMALYGTNLFVGGNLVEYYGDNKGGSPSDVLRAGLYEYSTVTKQKLSSLTLGWYNDGIFEADLHSPAICGGLSVQGTNLFVTGSFNYVYDYQNGDLLYCTNVAYWNGLAWRPLGNGLNGTSGINGGGFDISAASNAVFVSYGGTDAGGYLSETLGRWIEDSGTGPAATIHTFIDTSAGLSLPMGISWEQGGSPHLYIADLGDSDIWIWTSGSLSAWPGYYFSSPYGVAADSNGYIYVGDIDWGEIREFQGGDDPIDLDDNMGMGIALDDSEHLYCIQGNSDDVVKLDCVTTYNGSPDDSVTTVAGNGTTGYSGDGGAATSAKLNVGAYYSQYGVSFVASLAVDSGGNIYIADIGNNVVRKVNTSGIISTVAGDYSRGAGYSGDGGLAVNAQLNNPSAVAVDSSGNIYIADTGNNVVRRVDHTTGVITTFAGNGTAGYSGDEGPAASAELSSPSGLTFDSSGNLYISDTFNDVIRKVTFP